MGAGATGLGDTKMPGFWSPWLIDLIKTSFNMALNHSHSEQARKCRGPFCLLHRSHISPLKSYFFRMLGYATWRLPRCSLSFSQSPTGEILPTFLLFSFIYKFKVLCFWISQHLCCLLFMSHSSAFLSSSPLLSATQLMLCSDSWRQKKVRVASISTIFLLHTF